MTFTTTHFSYFGVAYVQKIFSDLTGVGWAKREIEVLASKGIVKGVSETEYAPFATITRADFLYPQGLSRFTKQFPSNIVRNVEKHFCTDGALLKPKVFLTEPMLAVDYSIIIPSNTPPDSYINGKLRSFSSGKIIVFNPCDTVVKTAAPPTKQYYTLFIRPQLIKKIAEEMGCPGEVRFLKLENPFSLDLLQAIRTFDKDST